MYVSRPVRQIRDDPVPGERVTLLLEVTEEASVERVRAAVERVEDVVVEAERPLDTLQVEVPHERVVDVCEVEGLAAVETAGALGVDVGDAGEDVSVDREPERERNS